MERISVPQICEETGISGDYYNEWNILQLRLLTGKNQEALDGVKQKPLRKYCDTYSADVFVDIVTDQNRDKVSRLDQLVDQANALGSQQHGVSLEDSVRHFKQILNEVGRLIYGPQEKILFLGIEGS